MIELQKHLTIKEAKNEVKKAENELDLYLTKKKINYLKQLPKGAKYDKIMISGGPISEDRLTHYMIKDEQYDSKIFDLQESINAYERYIIKEMRRLSELGDDKFKVLIMREDKKLEWDKISELTGYSKRQCIRIYKEFINS